MAKLHTCKATIKPYLLVTMNTGNDTLELMKIHSLVIIFLYCVTGSVFGVPVNFCSVYLNSLYAVCCSSCLLFHTGRYHDDEPQVGEWNWRTV